MTTTAPTQTETHALYRFYSDTGQLLYVGITNNPGSRFSQHQADKPWWHDVAGISVEKHNNRRDALAAEARAIEVERPLHNKVRPSLANRKRAATAPTRAPQRSLVWKCTACGEPVEGKGGYIHVNKAHVFEHERRYREVKERVRAKNIAAGHNEEWAGAFWNGADLLDLPPPVPWQVHHRDCDPDLDSPDYWFHVDRARTHAHLLNWTAHLMSKGWITATNWDDFIRHAAGVDA